MAATTQDRHWSTGRAFASMDPERQCEVVGYVRAIEVAPASRAPAERPRSGARLEWARLQVEREGANFEGGSGRRRR